MVKVFSWPPVSVEAHYWTMSQPLSRSQSLITGKSYVSSAQRKRILAGVDVYSLANYGAGYMEALWRMMEGGVHLVRLNSRCLVGDPGLVDGQLRRSSRLDWINSGEGMTWLVPPSEMLWLRGTPLSFTINWQNSYLASVTVTGLPPNSVVALPGEFYRVNSHDGSFQGSGVIVDKAESDSTGSAVVRVSPPPPEGGVLSLGSQETGAFELMSEWPLVKKRAGSMDSYLLEFRQVFEDERGPFEEVSPWI